MFRNIFVPTIALALCLSACGGGGGGGAGLASIPTPAPTPTPTPPPSTSLNGNFIPAATTTQQFTSQGTARTGDGNFLFADAGTLQVRYDAARRSYEVQMPGQDWASIIADPSVTPGGDVRLSWLIAAPPGGYFSNLVAADHPLAERRYSASSLAKWTGVGLFGDIAFGLPTPSSAIPTSGSASYSGLLSGTTNELVEYGSWGIFPASLEGTINMSFNFAAGTLSGSASPVIYGFDPVALPSMAFVNTLYSAGSTGFSGSLQSALPGPNGFSGRFTGSAAQELIGEIRFPYASPVSGLTYDAAGAFVAKK